MFRRSWSALAIAALAAACCKHGNGGSSNGGLENIDGIPSASPSPLDFGTIDTGSVVKKGLTLTNTGTGDLHVQTVSLAGDTSFAITPVPAQALQPGASFTVAVTFAPRSDGQHSATLTVTSDSSEKPSYQVPVTGVAFAYQVEVAPTELDFGEVQLGTTSQPQTITVTNDASAAEPLTVGPVTGPNASDFQSSSSATSSTAAGASFAVTVTFTPSTTGPETASLPVYACRNCPAVNVALTGTGTDTQIVLLDADTGNAFVSFGPVPQGTTATAHLIAEAQAIPSTAQSPLPATLGGLPALETGNDGFTVTPSDASFTPNPAAWPAALTPGSQSTSVAYFVVTYSPAAGTTSASDVVDVSYAVIAAAKKAQLPLSAGNAGGFCDQVVASPSSVAFGTVPANQTATQVVTLTNNGSQLCQLSNVGINPNDASDEFALQGGTVAQLSLSPGQSAQFTVSFTPASGSPPLQRTAVLSMTTNDTSVPTLQVPLSGTLQNGAYAQSAWPKWHHDNGNTGYTIADTSGNQGQKLWTVAIGKPAGQSGEFATYIHSPAIGKDPNSGDDIVYMLGYNDWVPSPKRGHPGSGTGLFYAVDGNGAGSTAAGTVLWSTPMTGPESSAQESTPTIVADNSIFVMTGGEQSYYPQFYHLSAGGQILWSGVQAIGGATFPCNFDSTGATNCSTVSTTPAINDGFDTCPGFDAHGMLYLFDDDQPGCDAYSSASSGQPTLSWSAKATGPTNAAGNGPHVESFSAALTDQSESIFSWGGMVLAFDATGSFLWGQQVGGQQPMTIGWGPKSSQCENDSKGSPGLSGTEAIVAFGGYDPTCTNINGGIVGFDFTTGHQDWGFQFPTLPPPPAPYDKIGYGSAIVAYSSPASLGDGGWVVGYLDGVYAFDPPAGGTGAATQRWKVPTGLVLSSPAVGGDGTVFVGSIDGNFYAIDGKKGTLKWKYGVGAAINSSPAIGSDGTVYFAADDGNLYALR